MIHRRSSGTADLAKVCIVSEGFYPPAIGGQQKYLHDLAAALTRQGLPVLVITRQPNPPAMTVEQVGQTRVLRLPPGGLLTGKGWRALFPLLLFLLRVFVTLLRERRHYDVILVSGAKTLPYPAVAASRILGKRCVIRPESPIELWQNISAKSLKAMGLAPGSRLVAAARASRLRFLQSADRMIAISSQMATELAGEGINHERIACIPYSIDTARYHPAAADEKERLRERLQLHTDEIIFVFTGRLTTSKGVPTLIEAWHGVTQRHPGARLRLLLVGSGAGCFDDCEAAARQAVAGLQLDERVTFTGAVQDVCDYLRAADVFIFPSLYEGFGLSIVEAMACGLPSIVTEVGVARDVLVNGVNGVNAGAGSREGLEREIHWMLAHRSLWDEMGARARADVVQRYGMDGVANQYGRLFKTLCQHQDSPDITRVTVDTPPEQSRQAGQS